MRRETRQGDKLIARWDGSFDIAETLGKGSYRIKKPNGEILKQRIASTRLKRFHPAEAEESDDPEKEAQTIKRIKENDDDDDSLSLIATESCHKAVAFRPITTATIQSIIQNRQLAFNRSQKNILEMIGNKTEVQYLPIETKPQVSDIIKVRGDGNCFFRFLSLNITGTETNHQVLRKAVVDYMKEHNEDFQKITCKNPKCGKTGFGPVISKYRLLLTSCKPTSIRTLKYPVKTQHWHG